MSLLRRLLPYAVACTSVFAGNVYVATNGSPSGTGSINRPYDLKTALGGGAEPGDTVWLRGGTYAGNFTCWVSGSPERPVIIRGYPGERARIDAGSGRAAALAMNCKNVWLWGLEVFFSNGKRSSQTNGSFPEDIQRGNGIATQQTAGAPLNLKFINMVIHDSWGAFGIWKEATSAEIYGSILFYDGWDGPDRGHGHAIYSQNGGPGIHRIEDNVMFSAFSHGLHVFSSQDLLQKFHIEGNISFDNGKLSARTGYATNFRVGATQDIPRNIVFRNNYSYYTPSKSGGDNQLGSTDGCENMVAEANYFVAENGTALIKPRACTSITMKDNTFVGELSGFAAADFPSNTYHARRPSGLNVFVRPNRYEPGRANIVVYNWDRKESVSVNVSAVCKNNKEYEVRDVQNYFGEPVAKGRCDASGIILIPMTSTAITAPVGSGTNLASHTDIGFGVFVIAPPARAALAETGAPVLLPAAFRNAAIAKPGPVSPGSVATLAGANLDPNGDGSGVSVTVDGIQATVLSASSELVRFQVPYEVQPGEAIVSLTVGDRAAEPELIRVQESAPGIFTDSAGKAAVWVIGASGMRTDGYASPGDVLAAYCTGQGLVVPADKGEASSDPDRLYVPVLPISVTIGQKPAQVLFGGLTPGMAGLCQFNVVVPELPDGDHAIELRVGENPSNAPVVSIRQT